MMKYVLLVALNPWQARGTWVLLDDFLWKLSRMFVRDNNASQEQPCFLDFAPLVASIFPTQISQYRRYFQSQNRYSSFYRVVIVHFDSMCLLNTP